MEWIISLAKWMPAQSSIRKQIFDLASIAFLPKTWQQIRQVVELLKRFAEKKKATPAQVALAWLLAQKSWIVPIPGTSKIDHLYENLGAVNLQLTPAGLSELETEFSKIKVHGGRMNEMQMQVVDQTQ